MRTTTVFIFFLLLFPVMHLAAQDTVKKAKKAVPYKGKEVSAETGDIVTGKKEEVDIAEAYEKLGTSAESKEYYSRAEGYYKKALNLYTSRKDKDAIARLTRSIAKVQEQQNKLNAAAKNYKTAGEVSSSNSLEEKLNANDYNRLKNSASPAEQDKYVRSNIKLLEKDNKKEEAAEAYEQKANISLKNNNNDDAINSFKKAITYTDKSDKVAEINSKLAKVFVADERYDEAIAATQDLLDSARAHNDYTAQISNLQTLSDIYFKKASENEGLAALKEAYYLAVNNGKIIQARKSLDGLLKYYRAQGNVSEITKLYDHFFGQLENLIKHDSSLVDAKKYQLTEQKIKQLEQEKVFKDELISRKNVFNYFLLGSMVVLLILSGFIFKSLSSIKVKNKEIALQSLRREMNPHFIFNSLNSVNQFISQNNELEANKFLTSYSNLMRNVMENSNRDFVLLNKEVEQLQKYLALEHMRFSEKFDYTITVDEHLDSDTTYVPNMVLQPHLENAIWHGLRYRNEKGLLLLNFTLERDLVKVSISDNGIGITKSRELKTDNQKMHESRGITNTKERIALLSQLYKKDILLLVTEKQLPETGVVVTITFPLIHQI